jgi:PTS system fructose-specific IIC component
MKKIVAVTSCPTGIAHTLMAAEALKKTAAVSGIALRVETQGSVGAKNVLTAEEIAAADAVVLATDIRIDTNRFAGKPVFNTRTSEAILHAKDVLDAALALAPAEASPEVPVTEAKAPESPVVTGKRLVGITSCPTALPTPSWRRKPCKKPPRRSDTR